MDIKCVGNWTLSVRSWKKWTSIFWDYTKTYSGGKWNIVHCHGCKENILWRAGNHGKLWKSFFFLIKNETKIINNILKVAPSLSSLPLSSPTLSFFSTSWSLPIYLSSVFNGITLETERNYNVCFSNSNILLVILQPREVLAESDPAQGTNDIPIHSWGCNAGLSYNSMYKRTEQEVLWSFI